MPGRVTIQDIANELGLSRNTVSKAINNTGGLSDTTRKRVLNKAAEMRYKQFSQGLSARLEEGVIAILSGSFIGSSHFASTMLDKFQREVSQLGYSTSLHRISPEEMNGQRLPATLNPDKVAGLICLELFDADYARMVCETGLPTLFVDAPAIKLGPPLKADILYMENMSPVQTLVQEMIRRGKSRMGFIGDPMHCRSFYERYVAYAATLHLLDMEFHPEFEIKEKVWESQQNLTNQLAAMPTLPDVFFCANDSITIDVLRSLRKLGYAVPDDVYLCGFDDSPESSLLTPSLTTVHIHSQIMGFSAAQLLISRIREPTLNFRTLYTETNVIFRESTADERREP